MKTLGYYNGRIDELDRITVPMLDRACYFGDGVYDVTFTRNHKIYMVEEHVSRLFQSARYIGIRPEMTEEELTALLRSLVLRLDDGEQWVYFQLSRGTDFRTHAFPPEAKPNLWIMLKPAKIKDTYRPLRCITLKDERSLYCNIKSLNLLPGVLATQETVKAGVDECILHRDGIVTECAHSNVSILKDGILITHPADRLILAGTGRAHLINTCRAFGIPVEERDYTLEELRAADEIILTSASALCMQITELDGERIGMKDGKTLRLLQDALLKDFLDRTE
ncbi:MAG: D-amino acid aminotransferase [Ruminococcaceae bacterium]|nr:D-amino acid aminotransferase [Oscillospiraceae bacterium]